MENPDYIEQKTELLESIERDQQEVRVALRELSGAAEQTFDIRERIRTAPLAWTFGALVVGAWLGSRSNGVAPVAYRRTR